MILNSMTSNVFTLTHTNPFLCQDRKRGKGKGKGKRDKVDPN